MAKKSSSGRSSFVKKASVLLPSLAICSVASSLFATNFFNIGATLSFALSVTFAGLTGLLGISLIFFAYKTLKPNFETHWSVVDAPVNNSLLQNEGSSSPSNTHQQEQTEIKEWYHVLLVGSSQVGKSMLFTRFMNEDFFPQYVATIGIDFRQVKCTIGDRYINLNIRELSGLERYRNFTNKYYDGSDGFLLVFNIADKQSFDALKQYKANIDEMVQNKRIATNVKFVLVGNKSDLQNARQVTEAEAQEYADSLGISYIETSAKSNTNVLECFVELVKKMAPQLSNCNDPARTIQGPTQ